MTQHTLFSIAPADKDRLRVMFLAKHACASGAPDPEDGNHAVYHHEVLTTLREIGLNVEPANDFPALIENEGFDYLFTLLNRAGFPMSEMLGPLMAQRIGLPYLGASPIIRGLSDDKHLMKTVAQLRGVPVSPWLISRRGGLGIPEPDFAFERLVVKPNASSASWGVSMPTDWDDARKDIVQLHEQGHDVIVERHDGEFDVVVAVLGGDAPIILPTVRFEMPGQDGNFRSYEEKRGLEKSPKEILVAVEDDALSATLQSHVEAMLPEIWPFDYGRFEFRYSPETRDISFMEVNLSCNLWSKKTISGAARLIGLSHASLMEHIVASSMDRQGVIEAVRRVIDTNARPDPAGTEIPLA